MKTPITNSPAAYSSVVISIAALDFIRDAGITHDFINYMSRDETFSEVGMVMKTATPVQRELALILYEQALVNLRKEMTL